MVPLITPVGPGGIHGVEGLVGRPVGRSVGHGTPMPGGACGGGTDDHRPHTHAVSTVRSVAGTSLSLAARALSSTRQRSILLHSSRITILSTTSYTTLHTYTHITSLCTYTQRVASRPDQHHLPSPSAVVKYSQTKTFKF